MISDNKTMDSPNEETENNNVKLLAFQKSSNDAVPPPLPLEDPPPTPPPPLPPPPLSLSPPPRPSGEHPCRGQTDSSSLDIPEEASDKPPKEEDVPHKDKSTRRSKSTRGTFHLLSGLYAKLLVLAAGVLVFTEILQNKVPLLFYHGYLFTYLIGGSVLCLLCIYFSLLLQKCPGMMELEELDEEDPEGSTVLRRIPRSWPRVSIFFRVGSLVFGLGTLIYLGLEVATLFTMEKPCMDHLNFIQPLLQALFTFMQMHYLSIKAQKAVHSLGWFRHVALMHLVAANLAVWLRLVVWETAKDWLDTHHISYNTSETWPPPWLNMTVHSVDTEGHHTSHISSTCLWYKHEEQKMEDLLALRQCFRNSTIGAIWDKALPFIVPFIVQYSLVGAAVSYVLWTCMNQKCRRITLKSGSWSPQRDLSASKRRENKRIDCKGSSKGLFLGLLVLAVGIVVLILFFVLTNNQNLKLETLFIMVTVHAGILGISSLGTLMGMCKVRQMCPDSSRRFDLHVTLQKVGEAAVYVHGICSIVVGANDLFNTNHLVVFVDGALMIFQSLVQAAFFHQVAQKCCTSKCEHQGSRPGRQVVTFLAFTNLVLWMTESFTDQNHVSSQLQLQFFGVVPWGIISRIILPLVVFYRFQSSVFLMETWKNSYNTDI